MAQDAASASSAAAVAKDAYDGISFSDSSLSDVDAEAWGDDTAPVKAGPHPTAPIDTAKYSISSAGRKQKRTGSQELDETFMRQRRRRGSVASLGTGREHSKISASRSSSANGRLPTGRRSSVSNSSQLKERRRQPRRSEGGGKWRWTMQGWVWVDKDGKEEVVDGGATSLLNDGTKHRRRASIKGEPAGSASVDVKGQERQNGTPKDQTDTADTRHMHTPDIPPSRVLSSPPSPQLNDTVQAAAALILLAANHRPDVAYPRTVDEDVLGPRSMNV